METGSVLRHLHQHGGWRKARAVPRLQALQNLDRKAGTQVVEIAEGTAQEGGEAEPEDGADVSVSRMTQDALLQAEHGLVQEGEQQPLLDLARIEGPGLPPGQQRVAARVYSLLLAA